MTPDATQASRERLVTILRALDDLAGGVDADADVVRLTGQAFNTVVRLERTAGQRPAEDRAAGVELALLGELLGRAGREVVRYVDAQETAQVVTS